MHNTVNGSGGIWDSVYESSTRQVGTNMSFRDMPGTQHQASRSGSGPSYSAYGSELMRRAHSPLPGSPMAAGLQLGDLNQMSPVRTISNKMSKAHNNATTEFE